MQNSLFADVAFVHSIQLDVLAMVGMLTLLAFLLGQLFRRFGIPQVIGFIVAGVLVGPSFLHLIPPSMGNSLVFVTEIALGLIGFDMGAHLRFADLREMSVSILVIVLLEALGAFVLVAGGVYLLTGELHIALIFGALASATDPASTVDVLNEYDASGPLTTRLLAVVGLDDALSLLLFSIGAALAESLLGGEGTITLLQLLELPVIEIGGSVLLGLVGGVIVSWIMDNIHISPDRHDAMVLPIGVVFLCAGLSRVFDLSVVLTTMTLGVFVVNRSHENGVYIRATIERSGPIVFVLFFVLAGARLEIAMLPAMGAVGVVYLLLRAAGKYFGARLGGAIGNVEPAVQKYLGLGILAQAGVVIGLALDARERFGAYGPEGVRLGEQVLTVITATTLAAQLVGPILTKYAITQAGEIARDVEAETYPHTSQELGD